MATKVTITCDHCGNKISKSNKFRFGPTSSRYDEDDDEEYAKKPARRKEAPLAKEVTIDLCATCVPIWMERVRKLTTTSDPE